MTANTTNEQEAMKWIKAGAKRTPEDIAASRAKAAEMLEKANFEHTGNQRGSSS